MAKVHYVYINRQNKYYILNAVIQAETKEEFHNEARCFIEKYRGKKIPMRLDKVFNNQYTGKRINIKGESVYPDFIILYMVQSEDDADLYTPLDALPVLKPKPEFADMLIHDQNRELKPWVKALIAGGVVVVAIAIYLLKTYLGSGGAA